MPGKVCKFIGVLEKMENNGGGEMGWDWFISN
jgi:hypothetical protein